MGLPAALRNGDTSCMSPGRRAPRSPRSRPGELTGGTGRGAQALAGLVALSLLVPPRPAGAASSPEALQQQHAACQERRDAGAHADAGACFEQVYLAFAELDPRASTDLFNVLGDTVGAYRAAYDADGRPLHLCRAAAVLRDYLDRRQKAEAIRLRRRVKTLAEQVDSELDAASRAAAQDICEAPAAAPAPDPAPQAEPKEPAPAGAAAPAAPPGPAPALKRLPPPRMRQAGGQAHWAAPAEPAIELLAAGFATSVGGAVTLGLGIGLLLYRAECADDTPDCSAGARATYRDAGYITMAAGAAVLLAGASLLFADQVQQRRRRAALAPTFGPGGGGVAIGGRF